jgi:membrane protease YdiL (CAAX protease family)
MKSLSHLLRRILFFPLTRILIAFFAVALAYGLVQVGMLLLGQALGLSGAPFWILLSAILMLIAAYGSYWLYVRVFEKRPLTELSFPGAPRELGAGILFGAALFTLVVGILWLLGSYHIAGINSITALMPILAVSLVSGLAEEILFRGILFRIPEESLGSWIALILSGLIFGAVHLANPNATLFGALAIALEAGLMLGAAFMLTRRLWFAVGIHFAWNFTQGGIYGVNVSGGAFTGLLESNLSGPEWLSGGAFGAEASVVAVIVCLAAFALLYYLAQKRDHVVLPFWARPKPSIAPTPQISVTQD